MRNKAEAFFKQAETYIRQAKLLIKDKIEPDNLLEDVHHEINISFYIIFLIINRAEIITQFEIKYKYF